ncbi:hypothetical protein MNEG_12201 [Monoraphidium neglectum]|jgi:hypothetical protein|uniref:Uncharacterized protein n=1 Tax=Monoraphidium neglectum TaxID=145388 RepID=A0A0D2MLT0_9CHLO|nr:hypothetical protein MNEG_12201 [Monoraphidium neglectum]KIY95760.1 hypothetical protein MNEG_12201 [Monoraphidium neglectum]|eukprot:XP_013894780.1 hypothetical protein MNEG_12201 [Monoraphidium neglectum]
MLAALTQSVAVPFLLPFTARPPRLGRQLLRLAAALPAAPFVAAYDGLASCVRAYSVHQLRAFAAQASTPDYQFVVRESPRRLLGLCPFRLRWIEGMPKAPDSGPGAGEAQQIEVAVQLKAHAPAVLGSKEV